MFTPGVVRPGFPARYIFNHVPKTGGLSLLAICRHNLDSGQISPHLTDTELRLGPVAQVEPYTLIAGHFSLAAHAKVSAGRYSVTLLREPIRKIYSTYTFWRQSPEVSSLTSKAKELSFADFVRYFEYHPQVILNPYTYHFAGFGTEILDNGATGPTLLAAAKHNLSAFDFIGICEEYEQSARLLCEELGWQLPEPIPHVNRTGSEEELDGIDRQTLEILHDRNQLDCQLYAYARTLFEARKRAHPRSVEPGSEDAQPPKPKSFLPFPAPSKKEREARIESVSAAWLPDGDSQVLEVAVKFRTKVEIAGLILGLAFFDGAGNNVWGTNTLLEGIELRHKPHCDCHATFVVQCAQAGIYSVTAAVHRPDRFGIHDHWLGRAASFEVAALPGPLPANLFTLRQIRSTVDSFVTTHLLEKLTAAINREEAVPAGEACEPADPVPAAIQ